MDHTSPYATGNQEIMPTHDIKVGTTKTYASASFLRIQF